MGELNVIVNIVGSVGAMALTLAMLIEILLLNFVNERRKRGEDVLANLGGLRSRGRGVSSGEIERRFTLGAFL